MPVGSGSPRGPLVPALLLASLLLLATPSPAPPGRSPAAPRAEILGAAAPSIASPLAGPAPAPAPLVDAAPSPWTNLTATVGSPVPSAREGSASAYDANDEFLLLFGGLGSRGAYLGDTWTWSADRWVNVTAGLSGAPSPRAGAAIAYDAADREVVLFGGFDAGGPLGDTWSFAGGSWTELNPPTSPPPLANASMAFDPATESIILFGGIGSTGTPSNSTWEFSAGNWHNLTSSLTGAPPPVSDGSLAPEGASGGLVLFGGQGSVGLSNQTWLLSASQWINESGSGPTPRRSAAFAYDAVDGFDVLFGGVGAAHALADTWSFSQNGWSRVAASPAPSARLGGAFAYVASTAPSEPVALLFGGAAGSGRGAPLYADTWSFKVPLSGNLTASPSELDLGQTTLVNVSAAGGYAPYSVTWPTLPTDCVGITTPGSFLCEPEVPGSAVFVAEVTDAANDSVVLPEASVHVAADPTVFDAALPAAGEAPLEVDFRVTVDGGTPPFSYDWSFGDGSHSTLGNTSHTYAALGAFRVNLTITDAVGQLAEAAPLTVESAGPLVANASASAYGGVAPLTVAFNGTARGGLSPYSYNWSFGVPGGYSEDPNAVYTFARAGTYTVSLLVSDSLGGENESNLSLTVLPSLEATFNATFPDGAGCAGGIPYAELALSASPSGGVAPYNETWTIGARFLYGPDPTLNVTGGTGLTVRLVVLDAAGDLQNVSEGVTTPAASCTVPAPPSGPSESTLLWIVLGILAATVAVEGIVIGARRRSRDEEEAPEEEAPEEPPATGPST